MSQALAQLRKDFFSRALQRSPDQVLPGRRVIGVEHEFLFLDLAGRLVSCRRFFDDNFYPVPHTSGTFGIVDEEATFICVDPSRPSFVSMFGAIWSTDASIGTFEWSSPRYRDLSRLRGTVLRLHSILAKGMGLRAVASFLACQPVEVPRPSLWPMDARYQALQEALNRPAVHTMACSAGIQQNIDLSGEREVVQALNVFNELSFAIIALSANSPLFCGLPSGLMSNARAFYTGAQIEREGVAKEFFTGLPTDPQDQRVGLVPRVDCLEEYFDWLIDLKYLIHIDQGGAVTTYNHSFRQFAQERGSSIGAEGLRRALLTHEGSVHTDARYRGTFGGIEVRAQDQDASTAGHALALGLAMNLDEAHELTRERSHQQWLTMRQQAVHSGILGVENSLLREILRLAERGLQKAEENWQKHLAPYWRRLQEGRCPARDVLAWYEKGGIPLVVKNTAITAIGNHNNR